MFDSYRENTLVYNPDLCINCRRCTQVCPHGVFTDGEKQAVLARPSECMECGACAFNCPTRAISVESGVGCAWAMIAAALRGRDMDACTCGADAPCCGGDKAEETGSCCGGPDGTCSAGEGIEDPSSCCGGR